MIRLRAPFAAAALALALGLAAGDAAAAGLNLYAGDCGAGTPATSVTNACTLNAGSAFRLIGSVVLPTGTIPQFSGCESILDVQTDATGTIQDWWRADACRASGFAAQADSLVIGGACATVWDHAAPQGTTLNALFADGAPPDRLRFLIETTVDPTVAPGATLVGDGVTERSVFAFTALRANSNGPGACVGCNSPACLVLQEIGIRTLLDAGGTHMRITDVQSNRSVNYNGSLTTAVCPSSVPVRQRTWGMLKSLYR